MERFLEELFYGRVYPFEREFHQNPERLNREDKLLSMLHGEERQLLLELLERMEEEAGVMELECFIRGVKIGFAMNWIRSKRARTAVRALFILLRAAASRKDAAAQAGFR